MVLKCVIEFSDGNNQLKCLIPSENISNIELFTDDIAQGDPRIEIKDKFGMKLIFRSHDEVYLKKYAQKILDEI